MTERKIIVSTPLYEIIDEEEPSRRPRGQPGAQSAVASIARAIRHGIEAAYVSFAGGAMSRVEQIEDARAQRAFDVRQRKARAQRLRNERSS